MKTFISRSASVTAHCNSLGLRSQSGSLELPVKISTIHEVPIRDARFEYLRWELQLKRHVQNLLCNFRTSRATANVLSKGGVSHMLHKFFWLHQGAYVIVHICLERSFHEEDVASWPASQEICLTCSESCEYCSDKGLVLLRRRKNIYKSKLPFRYSLQNAPGHVWEYNSDQVFSFRIGNICVAMCSRTIDSVLDVSVSDPCKEFP